MNTHRIHLDNWHAAVEADSPRYIAERAPLHLQLILTKQWAAHVKRNGEDKPWASTVAGKAPRKKAAKALGQAWAAAILAAEKETTKHYYFLPELAGVTNPWKDDPDFGWGDTTPAAEAPAPDHKPNKYAGTCHCGQTVAAGTGALVKRDGKWAADHVGPCPEKPAQAKPAAVTGLDLSTMVPGYYAVPGGDTRLKLAISQGKNKWDGFTFVKDGAEYGNGNRYGMQKPGERYRGKLEPELAIILADPKAAMAAYGLLVGKCGACGRKLEDETSLKLGIGPVCLLKF